MKLEMQMGEIRRHLRRRRTFKICSNAGKNPVQALGLDLPFLIVTSISLQAAAAISIELFFIHMGTVICALFLCRALPGWSRPIVYVMVSTLIMLAVSALLNSLFPAVTDKLGMYIYLMAVNGMTFAAAMNVEKNDKIYLVVTRAFKGAAGFIIAMFVTSLFREYFGNGALWGMPVPHIMRTDGLLSPFFGFILLGFLLAGTRLLNKRLIAITVIERARREALFKAKAFDAE